MAIRKYVVMLTMSVVDVSIDLDVEGNDSIEVLDSVVGLAGLSDHSVSDTEDKSIATFIEEIRNTMTRKDKKYSLLDEADCRAISDILTDSVAGIVIERVTHLLAEGSVGD